MGQLTSLITGKLVAFDSAPLIYYIEEHAEYLAIADELFGLLDSGAARGMTSVLTLEEVLVKPLKEGRAELADQYRQVLTNSTNITLHPSMNQFARPPHECAPPMAGCGHPMRCKSPRLLIIKLR